MHPETAAKVLVGEGELNSPTEYELALLAFSVWLNWPNQPAAVTRSLFVAICRLLAEDNGTKIPESNWLIHTLEPKRYLELLDNDVQDESIFLPRISDIESESGYDETRYTADIVRFMLSYKTRSQDKRKQASLGKAADYLQRFSFVEIAPEAELYPYSDSRHQEIWRDYTQQDRT